jgi:hypothetical protein
MKRLAFVPPVLALLVTGLWIGVQRNSIAGLVQQNELLKRSIEQARTSLRTEENDLSQPADEGPAAAKKAIDWKKVAAQVTAARKNDRVGENRAIRQLERQLRDMSEQELWRAWEEIAALDLPAEIRMELESMLTDPLVEKSPEAFLSRFIDRLENGQNQTSWQLASALANWAKKNPTAALEWFDTKIAAGTFNSKSLDGKSHTRLQFEGRLVSSLLSSDPEAAANRMAGLPPEQRKEALRYGGPFSMEGMTPVFADLVRKQLPQEDQAKAIANAAPVNFSGDYGKITDYMNEISASPAERDVCVEQAGSRTLMHLSLQRKLKREDIDRLREWTAKESPAMSDRTTGKALASVLSNNRIEFAEAAEMALHYQENGAGDEVLLPLLENQRAQENKDAARKLTQRISDETRREEILRKLN